MPWRYFVLKSGVILGRVGLFGYKYIHVVNKQGEYVPYEELTDRVYAKIATDLKVKEWTTKEGTLEESKTYLKMLFEALNSKE